MGWWCVGRGIYKDGYGRSFHTYPGLPSGVLGCPRLVLGYGMGWDLGLGLEIGVWGHPRTVVGNPR